MPRRNDSSKILVIRSGPIVLGLVILLSSSARACSVFSLSVAAAPNFDVLVADRGRPIPGIPIIVWRVGDKSRKPIVELESDQDGKVPVRGLLPGEYAIENRGPIQMAGLVAVVKAHGPQTLGKPIIFEWPWHGVVESQSLQGALRAADPGHPFQEIDLSLLTADSGAKLQTLRTGPDGSFKFKDVSPGLYVIQVHTSQPGVDQDWEVHGPIAVRLVPDSQSASPDVKLTLGETSCGIWYAQCHSDPITLATRKIRVFDSNGALIGVVQYRVEDASGNKIVAGESNWDGMIELPGELSGAYKLSILHAGFTPLEQPLEVLVPNAEAGYLSVLLNVGGFCSQAKLEKHAAQK
jgi:hypothetical protein